MKVQNCKHNTAFGGINFVFEYLEEGNFIVYSKYFPGLEIRARTAGKI